MIRFTRSKLHPNLFLNCIQGFFSLIGLTKFSIQKFNAMIPFYKIAFLLFICFLSCTIYSQELVKNLAPGGVSSFPHNFYKFDESRIVFFADDGSGIVCLYISDGSDAGTLKLADFGENPSSFTEECGDMNTYNFSKIDSLGYCVSALPLASPDSDVRLIRTNGTVEGTYIFPICNSCANPCRSNFFKTQNKICWLSGSSGIYSYDVSSNDIDYNTLNSSSLGLIDIMKYVEVYNAGVIINGDSKTKQVLCNEDGFFAIRQTNPGIYRIGIDGTISDELFALSQYNLPSNGEGVLVNDKFIFEGLPYALDIGLEPFYFDISNETGGLLMDINPYFNYSSDPHFVPLPFFKNGFTHNSLYFLATDADYGRELWLTDGTTSGTYRVTDINPGPLDSFGPFTSMDKYIYIGDSIMLPSNSLWGEVGVSYVVTPNGLGAMAYTPPIHPMGWSWSDRKSVV